mgnify:CR=1 FL=1
MTYKRRKDNVVADSDEMDFYEVTHMRFLLQLRCNIPCKWNVKKNGMGK